MSFQKIVSVFFKEDPLVKELRRCHLFSNSLTAGFLEDSLRVYGVTVEKGAEESLIKVLLKALQEKGQAIKKLKIMSFWIQIFKETKYDLSDIIMDKKLKVFNKNSLVKQGAGNACCMNFAEQQKITELYVRSQVDLGNLEEFLLAKVLIPLYNYFMKLSLNEELFKLCVIGKVPEDEVFRRGSKIKFIWIFKLYNLINPLIPITANCAALLDKFPFLTALKQIALQCYKDILIMNDFVIEAIEEGAQDNFFLMPYFEMLQFYETLEEQGAVGGRINRLYESFSRQSKLEQSRDKVEEQDREKEKQMKVNANSSKNQSKSKSKSKNKNKKMDMDKNKKMDADKNKNKKQSQMGVKESQEGELKNQEFFEEEEEFVRPRVLYLEEEVREEIEAQTLKVKLISNSMKNPKKDHTRLETQYNQKVEGINSRALKTMEDQHVLAFGSKVSNLMDKYKNLG